MKIVLQMAAWLVVSMTACATHADDGDGVRLGCQTNGAAGCVLQRDSRGALQMGFSYAGRDVARVMTGADGDGALASNNVPMRRYSSARFDFAECRPGGGGAVVRRDVVAVKDAGVFLFIDRVPIGPANRTLMHRWAFVVQDAGRPVVDAAKQEIRYSGKGFRFLARFFGPAFSIDAAIENGGAQIKARRTGGDAAAFVTLVIPDASIVRDVERSAAAGSVGFALTLTNDMRILCLASAGDTAPPLTVRQLGVSARLAIMAGWPNQPVHGLLFGASILPADTNSPPVWSSIQRVAAGEALRAISVTLPQDCEFCLSESFEVIAPLPDPGPSR